MGKLRWIPVLMLIALLASDAAAAQGRTSTTAQASSGSTLDVSVTPSTGTVYLGGGGSGGTGLGGLQGDPDDLIDGNRAKPKLGAAGATGPVSTGGLLSNTILWVRLYGLAVFLKLMLR